MDVPYRSTLCTQLDVYVPRLRLSPSVEKSLRILLLFHLLAMVKDFIANYRVCLDIATCFYRLHVLRILPARRRHPNP